MLFRVALVGRLPRQLPLLLGGLRAFSPKEREARLPRVFLVHSYDPHYLWSQGITQGVQESLRGKAADVIKLAMLAVAHDAELKSMYARLLLQVHDELLLEVPTGAATAAGERVAALMSGVMPGGAALSVPLVVDWGQGRDWGSAH